jgi:ribosomal protein S18 acetylase RimI-like enzyme
MAADVRIVRGGVERIPDLEPLTRALHSHHQTVDPEVPGVPPRDEDAWWRIRSERYRGWLADDDGFVLVAEQNDMPIGYALITFHGADDSHVTGDSFAELQSLAVLAEHRGRGVGRALLDEVYRQVREAGVHEMVIGVLATNEPALRLYRKDGFRPWVILTMGKVPDPDARAEDPSV